MLSRFKLATTGLVALRQYSTQSAPLYDKVLIANRGEIACRVIRTCKKLGIKTVAIHSDVDAQSLHVAMADEAVLVGGAASADSYLNMDKVLEAIKTTGSQAVHPGYGFLSENSHFAEALKKINVDFIGPNVFAIEAMGDKIQSKLLAAKAGVNTIPGFDGEIDSVEQALKVSNDITYPVMVKASAGGGGKGMRIAWNDEECTEAYHLCKQEAKSSFGDDRLLIEKYIDNPRHIEIQVMTDKHGNGVFLNERECSIQRRNQKVIEEAPSVFLNTETRNKMGEQALMLSKAVNYDSAGTVEFLVDSQRNFYFLEMNTRLQVEHPITEYITGVDLVEQMLRSSKGLELNITQDDVAIKGWALESRVYAEDPTKMLPSIGRLEGYIQPKDYQGDESVRVDTGVVEGSDISIYYDPMICKLITYGKDRTEAIDKMLHALDTYYIKGVKHNIPLLRDVINSEHFKSGNISTKFLLEEYPDGFKGTKLNDAEVERVALAAAIMRTKMNTRLTELDNYEPIRDYFAKPDATETVVDFNGKITRAVVEEDVLGSFKIATDTGGEFAIEGTWQVGEPFMELHIDGEEAIFQHISSTATSITVGYRGSLFEVGTYSPRAFELNKLMPEPVEIDMSKLVVSPMPGAVVSVNVEVGDKVGEGQEVAIVEAMKMQNSLRALRSGTVKKVLVKAGDAVAVDEILIEFEN